MKRIRNIIAITLSIIILTNSTLSYTTVCASPQLPSTSISIIKAQDRAFTVKWKKKSGITGYQIQYSTNSKFKKGNKSIKIKNAKTVSKKITKLKVAKKYYVRIRTYKGKKYSKWSKVKSAKISKESKSNMANSSSSSKKNSYSNSNNNSVKDNTDDKYNCSTIHPNLVGNSGKWFANKSDANKYGRQAVASEDYDKLGGDVYGYECWSCPNCGKWTVNFYYR